MQNDESSPKIPVVNTERCIGCGACENLCPSTSVQCHLCGRTRNASCYLNEIERKMDKLIKLLHEGNYSCVIKE